MYDDVACYNMFEIVGRVQYIFLEGKICNLK